MNSIQVWALWKSRGTVFAEVLTSEARRDCTAVNLGYGKYFGWQTQRDVFIGCLANAILR